MCCDSCPRYEDCSINDELKDRCCTKCPDHDVCYSRPDEDRSELGELDKDNE